jgi:hypothetical protein
MLRIGLIRYDKSTLSGGGKGLTVECYISGTSFGLQPVCGVAADDSFVFLGNVAPHVLDADPAQVREFLRGNARERRKQAHRLQQAQETSIANRLLAEALERERRAAEEIWLPLAKALSRVRKANDAWQPYPLLPGSTAVMYQGWFPTPDDATATVLDAEYHQLPPSAQPRTREA